MQKRRWLSLITRQCGTADLEYILIATLLVCGSISSINQMGQSANATFQAAALAAGGNSGGPGTDVPGAESNYPDDGGSKGTTEAGCPGDSYPNGECGEEHSAPKL